MAIDFFVKRLLKTNFFLKIFLDICTCYRSRFWRYILFWVDFSSELRIANYFRILEFYTHKIKKIFSLHLYRTIFFEAGYDACLQRFYLILSCYRNVFYMLQ